MSITYKHLSGQPVIFNRLAGMNPEDFSFILKKLTPLWEKKILGTYKRPGRHFKLELADMLLMLLVYYRSYISQAFVGHLFGIDDSRVCRIIQKLEPLLARIMALPHKKTLTRKELESLIVDATEQSIERPGKGQKLYYSGKKKRYTLKKEIRVTGPGRIIHTSKACPGSIHDFQIYKHNRLFPKTQGLLSIQVIKVWTSCILKWNYLIKLQKQNRWTDQKKNIIRHFPAFG